MTKPQAIWNKGLDPLASAETVEPVSLDPGVRWTVGVLWELWDDGTITSYTVRAGYKVERTEDAPAELLTAFVDRDDVTPCEACGTFFTEDYGYRGEGGPLCDRCKRAQEEADEAAAMRDYVRPEDRIEGVDAFERLFDRGDIARKRDMENPS